jgi:predicted transcriptional regulator
MELKVLRNKIKEFDKKAGWDKTEFKELMGYMQKELDNLKSSLDNKDRVNHLLTDMLVLIMQISYRYNTDFDFELEQWFREAVKYTK